MEAPPLAPRRRVRRALGTLDDLALTVVRTLSGRRARVLFDVSYEIGLDAQVPVIRQLLERGLVRVSVTSGRIPSTQLRAELRVRGLPSVSVISKGRAALDRHDIMVITDFPTIQRWRRRRAVYLHHGSSSGDRAFPFAFSLLQDRTIHSLLCIAQSEADAVVRLCGTEFRDRAIVVGQPKLDEFREDPAARADLLRSLDLDPAKRTVLVHSHWTATSLFRSYGVERIMHALAGTDVNVLVAAHRHLFDAEMVDDVDWRQRLTDLCEGPNVRVIMRPVERFPLLNAADLMIGDHSSTCLEFALLRRPMHIFRDASHRYSDGTLETLLSRTARFFGRDEIPSVRGTPDWSLDGEALRHREALLRYAFAYQGESAARSATVIETLAVGQAVAR